MGSYPTLVLVDARDRHPRARVLAALEALEASGELIGVERLDPATLRSSRCPSPFEAVAQPLRESPDEAWLPPAVTRSSGRPFGAPIALHLRCGVVWELTTRWLDGEPTDGIDGVDQSGHWRVRMNKGGSSGVYHHGWFGLAALNVIAALIEHLRPGRAMWFRDETGDGSGVPWLTYADGPASLRLELRRLAKELEARPTWPGDHRQWLWDAGPRIAALTDAQITAALAQCPDVVPLAGGWLACDRVPGGVFPEAFYRALAEVSDDVASSASGSRGSAWVEPEALTITLVTETPADQVVWAADPASWNPAASDGGDRFHVTGEQTDGEVVLSLGVLGFAQRIVAQQELDLLRVELLELLENVVRVCAVTAATVRRGPTVTARWSPGGDPSAPDAVPVGEGVLRCVADGDPLGL